MASERRQSDRGRQASAISSAVTRIHREHYGRGATTARTIINRNYVVSILEDIYTTVERTLIDAGREEVVRETRHVFQDAMRPALTAAVEEATGRRVIAFMSQVHFDPDMAAEVFVLQPEADDREHESNGLAAEGRGA